VQTNTKSQLDDAIEMVVVVSESVGDAQDSRFAEPHAATAVCPQLAVPLRAMTQTWLL